MSEGKNVVARKELSPEQKLILQQAILDYIAKIDRQSIVALDEERMGDWKVLQQERGLANDIKCLSIWQGTVVLQTEWPDYAIRNEDSADQPDILVFKCPTT